MASQGSEKFQGKAELSVAGMNDTLQAIRELSSRKPVCDCRSMGQKKIACPCVGLSPMLNKSEEQSFVCEALLAPERNLFNIPIDI